MIRNKAEANPSSDPFYSTIRRITVFGTALLVLGLLIRLGDEVWLVRNAIVLSTGTAGTMSRAALQLDLILVYTRLVAASIVILWGLSSGRLLGFLSSLVGAGYLVFEYYRWRLISQQLNAGQGLEFPLLRHVTGESVFSMNKLVVLFFIICLGFAVIGFGLVKKRRS